MALEHRGSSFVRLGLKQQRTGTKRFPQPLIWMAQDALTQGELPDGLELSVEQSASKSGVAYVAKWITVAAFVCAPHIRRRA